MRSTSSLAPQVTAALAALEVAADQLASLVAQGALIEVPLPALPALVVRMHRASDRVLSAAHSGTQVVHASQLQPSGHGTTTRWLQAEAGLSPAESSAVLARSGSLADNYGATQQAWLDGRISGAKAAAISRGIDESLRNIPESQRVAPRAEAEQALLAIAETGTVSQVQRAATRLRHHLDPAGSNKDMVEAHRDQRLSFTPTGPGYTVAGYLTAESTAALLTVLDQRVDAMHRTGALPKELRSDGDGMVATRQRRLRRPHLLALALGELASEWLSAGQAGGRHDVRPHVTVTVDLDHLLAGIGGQVLMPGHDDPALIPAASVARVLCDAEVTTVITHAPPGTDRATLTGRIRDLAHPVLYVGRSRRIVSPRQRRALDVRDQHCAFPDCAVDTSRCQAHHVTPWEHGGSTDLDNSVLLCDRHHHAVHEGGWTIRAVGDDPGQPGYFAFLPPARAQAWAA